MNVISRICITNLSFLNIVGFNFPEVIIRLIIAGITLGVDQSLVLYCGKSPFHILNLLQQANVLSILFACHVELVRHWTGGKVVNEDVEMGRQWMRWLNKRATEWNVNLPWGQLGNFVYWPSQDAVQRNNGKMIDGEWVDNRKGREYTESLSNALIIHFQSPDGHDGMSLCDG